MSTHFHDDSSALAGYLQQIGRHAVLTREEERALFVRLRDGDASVRETLIRCNLRLVVRLAVRFQNKGLPLEDLIQEGNIGLLQVIERFDPTLGYRFSTYAAFWIRQAIQVAIRKHGSLIRLPVRKGRLLGQMNEVVQRCQSLQGRAPTRRELAKGLKISEETVEELLQIAQVVTSLDAPVEEGEGLTIQERLPDRAAVTPTDAAISDELCRKIRQALQQLSEREKDVLEMRFGLVSQEAMSLRSVSERVGMSQEGVRRVEQRALAHLSKEEETRELAAWM